MPAGAYLIAIWFTPGRVPRMLHGVGVGHAILVIIDQLLRDGALYQDRTWGRVTSTSATGRRPDAGSCVVATGWATTSPSNRPLPDPSYLQTGQIPLLDPGRQ